MADNQEEGPKPFIGVKNLTFKFPDGSSGLQDIQLDLPPRSRTLLIGGTKHFLPAATSRRLACFGTHLHI